MTSPEGSIAKRAIALIEKHGSARSTWIAEQLGVRAKDVSSALYAYCINGTLVTCKVEKPNSAAENEYRMSNAGAGMAFVIRGDVTRSPAVRSGTVARPTPTHPSGLHLEAVHGRPKATDDRRTALVAEAWPGTDTTSTNDQVEKVADEVAAPAGMQADEATDISKGDSDARSEGTGADHVVARVAAPSSRPAMAAPTSSTFRCALANDGSLLLMRTGDEPIDLSPSDTRALVTYLRKLEELSYPRIDETDLPSPLRTQAK